MVIGAAVGNIMATIMTAHIASLRANSVVVQGWTAAMESVIGPTDRPPIPADPFAIPRAVITTYAQAAAVSTPSPVSTTSRSRCRQTQAVFTGSFHLD